MVCVPADRDANPVRQFGANTVDLHQIVAWLKQCGVKTVALESAGVYWIPRTWRPEHLVELRQAYERMAARSAGKTMTHLGLFYRRIRSRIGGLGAVKATAHKLACLVYRMLKYGQEYVVQSMEEYEVKANVVEGAPAQGDGHGLPTQPRSHQRVDPIQAGATARQALDHAQR